MSDPQRNHVHDEEPTYRRWKLRVCDCGVLSVSSEPCAGFPGVWDDDLDAFQRGACIAEFVDVIEIPPKLLADADRGRERSC